jgi:hypothetical protein
MKYFDYFKYNKMKLTTIVTEHRLIKHYRML